MKIYTKNENGILVSQKPTLFNVDVHTAENGYICWSLYQGKLYIRENDENVEILQPYSTGDTNIASDGHIGDFVYYMGDVNPDPAHLLVCDGSEFDTTEFADLYTLLGSNRTPNMVNRMLRGTGSSGKISNHDTVNLMASQDISAQGGFHKHSALYPTVPHTHTVSVQGEHRHNVWGGSQTYPAWFNRRCTTIVTSSSGASCAETNIYTSGTNRAGASQGTVTMTGYAGTPISDGTNGAARVGNFTKGKTRTCLILIRGKI